MKESNPEINFQYLIVGDGPQRERLRKLVDEKGLSKNIEFVGWMDRETVRDVIRESDICLVPSITSPTGDQEGIPNVLKEAMVMKVLCIGSQHSGIPEIIKHERTGYLFPEGDSCGLAEVIIKAISQQELWHQMREQARREVVRAFDSEYVADLISYQYSLSEEQFYNRAMR